MRNIYTHYDKALYHLTTYERFFALPSAQGKAYSGRVKMRDLEKRTGVHRETIRFTFGTGSSRSRSDRHPMSPTMARRMSRRCFRYASCSATQASPCPDRKSCVEGNKV